MLDRSKLALRASIELSAASTALHHAHFLFTMIERLAEPSSDIAKLALIGAELIPPASERSEAESEFFAEVSHG